MSRKYLLACSANGAKWADVTQFLCVLKKCSDDLSVYLVEHVGLGKLIWRYPYNAHCDLTSFSDS